jgi:hypothetical protein
MSVSVYHYILSAWDNIWPECLVSICGTIYSDSKYCTPLLPASFQFINQSLFPEQFLLVLYLRTTYISFSHIAIEGQSYFLWDEGLVSKVEIFLVLRRFEFRTSQELKGSTPWATPPALFCIGYFWDRVSRTICPSWLWTVILLIPSSIGLSHKHPA